VPAAALTATLMPSGSTTPYEHNFSQEDSFIIRGDFKTALHLYEMGIKERPTDVEVRVRAAELYAAQPEGPLRAAELLREVQRLPNAMPEKVLFATHRLIDLYIGPLQQPGRALGELRRVVDTWPNSSAAKHAREAIARLKAEQGKPDEG
jgi:hypothetical protein